MSRTLGAPATPAKPTATAGDGTATVTWSAPDDGGSTITKYTVTPYIGSTAQTPKDVTGSPAATSTTISGLTNGTAYTFKVSATNAVGTSAQSAASDPVTPAAPVAGALAFVQQVNKRGVAASLALQPTAAVTTGDRLIVQVGVWSYGKATASGVTDSAGNTYTKLTSVKASDDTELSVWSAPDHRGRRDAADGHRHDHGQRRHRRQRARVLGSVDRSGDRRGRRAQDRDGHDQCGRQRVLRGDRGQHRRRRAGDGLLRRLGLRQRAHGRPDLHGAHQRLADRRHGAAGPGPRPDRDGHHCESDHQDRGQHPVAGGHAGAQERRAAGRRGRGPVAGAVRGADGAHGGQLVGRHAVAAATAAQPITDVPVQADKLVYAFTAVAPAQSKSDPATLLFCPLNFLTIGKS